MIKKVQRRKVEEGQPDAKTISALQVFYSLEKLFPSTLWDARGMKFLKESQKES
jgi:hypothetical protein